MHNVQKCDCSQTYHSNAEDGSSWDVVALDEQNPNIRNIRDDQAGREQRSTHNRHVELPRRHFSAGKNSEWSNRFRQACKAGGSEDRELEEVEETELNGVEEGRDGMSDEGGDTTEGEQEFEAPDWRIRAGSRNKPTQKEREEHDATHVPFRDWCTHCMTGRSRNHHHMTKQKSEDQSRRHTIEMDYHFVKMNSAVNARTMLEESLTCIAVKEDRQQNIMSSVALKNGAEEPWTIERVVKFIDSLGYRDITLKRH